MSEESTKPLGDENPVSNTSQQVSVKIGLQPVDHSEQPIYSNFTAVQGVSGVVFVDFGFLEPQAMRQLAQLAQPGAKVPESIGGKLACRMAISVETAANLAQQLNQLLRNVTVQQGRAQRQQGVKESSEAAGVTH